MTEVIFYPDLRHFHSLPVVLYLQQKLKFVHTAPTQPFMESKEGIDALFMFATEGILVVNDRGEITRINPSAEILFGYEKNELLGKKIEVLIPQRFTSQHASYREKYSQHPHARSMGAGMELYGRRKDGSELPVEISLSPYSSNEGKFVIAFIIDITLRKQAENRLKNYSAELENQVKNRTLILEEAIRELEITKQELNQALDKEKELGELKSRFVSMASHEFRTPLATIMTSLSLISKYGGQNDKANQNKHITKIKTSVNALTDILNDLLSVSRLEEGKVTAVHEPFNIKDFITEIISELRNITDNRQQVTHIHKGDEQTIGDKKILKHILLNLITNAIKFSPNEKPVEVESFIKDGQIMINITDHGIGIPEEDQKHLFERFFRAHNATNIQGTGLGLNIVARYLDLLQGTIEFKSKVSEGTAFYIQIPVPGYDEQ